MAARRAATARWAAAAAGLAACLGAGQAPADSTSLELAVKATYLYKLAPFVSWPAQAVGGPTAPLVICVQGADPFGSLLDRAVDGQQTAGHRIAVVRLSLLSQDAHCQMLYIAPAAAPAAHEIEAAVQGAPVLTVTDSIGDASAKGMINFVIADNRVRFEIDDAAAKRSGLQVSSKLLSLAVSVRAAP